MLAVLRAAPWRIVVTGGVGGAVLLLLTLRGPSAPLLALGLGGLAASAAFVLDEPAAAAVAAAPRRLRWRSAVRGLLLAVPLVAGAAALVVVGSQREEGASEGGLLALAGVVAVAVALAAVARRVMPTPGELTASAVALAVVTVGIAEPFGRWVVLLPDGPADARTKAFWAALVLASLVALVWATRDPLSRWSGRRTTR